MKRKKAKKSLKKRPQVGGQIVLREATKGDLKVINDIYNHYVLHSTCTYQETLEPMAGRRNWFERHGPNHPVIVAVQNGTVLGWGSLSAYHARSAYRNTVENSIYIHYKHQRQGLGSLLLEELIERARKIGHRTIIAVIDADQPGSIALHEKFGFEHVGHFKEVGFKFGRWLDVVYMQLMV